MTPTYNMLTGIDLSPMDDNLFFFLAKYASAFQTNKVCFLNKNMDFFDALTKV